MRRLAPLGIIPLLAFAAWLVKPLPAEEKDDAEPKTLLGSLSEWQYPDSKLRGGATVSDGGDPSVADHKMQAVLVTPDPVERVIEYYSKRLTADAPADNAQGPAPSVCVQDDSKDRPVTVRVINVNEADRSTTLVISRADDERETHIVWTQYERFPNVR